MSNSAWGPFLRYTHNPVFSLWDENVRWCDTTSSPARVDEIKATKVRHRRRCCCCLLAGCAFTSISWRPRCVQVGPTGAKFLIVKSVCENFTALPVLYSPIDQSSWGPPYQTTPQSIAHSP